MGHAPRVGSLGLHPVRERRRFRARGVVQGVGFRPFVHRLARETGVAGWVLNDGEGVLIEAEGSGLDRFAAELVGGAPPLARVESLTVETIEPVGETTFRILASVPSGRSAAIGPPSSLASSYPFRTTSGAVQVDASERSAPIRVSPAAGPAPEIAWLS